MYVLELSYRDPTEGVVGKTARTIGLDRTIHKGKVVLEVSQLLFDKEPKMGLMILYAPNGGKFGDQKVTVRGSDNTEIYCYTSDDGMLFQTKDSRGFAPAEGVQYTVSKKKVELGSFMLSNGKVSFTRQAGQVQPQFKTGQKNLTDAQKAMARVISDAALGQSFTQEEKAKFSAIQNSTSFTALAGLVGFNTKANSPDADYVKALKGALDYLIDNKKELSDLAGLSQTPQLLGQSYRAYTTGEAKVKGEITILIETYGGKPYQGNLTMYETPKVRPSPIPPNSKVDGGAIFNLPEKAGEYTYSFMDGKGATLTRDIKITVK
jgi:hypothetical protein